MDPTGNFRPRAQRAEWRAAAALGAALAAAALAGARAAGAQDLTTPTAAERGPRFLATPGGAASPVPIDPERTPFLRARIAVDVRGQTVAAAVETIARVAGIRVMYSPALLPAGRRVELQASGISVASALSDVLIGTDLDVLLSVGGQAVLVRRPTRDAQPRQQLVTILGQVTDSASRRPLAGVQVALGGAAGDRTTHTAVADAAGQYRLPGVTAGTYTLTARRVGYAPTRQRVVVTATQNVTVNVRLAASANPLERVVVTGTVVATREKALPNAITVVTGAQLAQRNITQLTELFRGEVPGVYALNTGVGAGVGGFGGSGVYARGSSTLDGSGSPLKVYVDGIELSDPGYLNTIDPKMIDRVEIITGPEASTVYGSGAINGVMQVFTKRGAFGSRPRLTAQVGYGVIQNNYSSGLAPSHDDALQLSGGGENLSYQVGASYTATGQWTPGDYTKNPIATGGLRYQAPAAHLTVDLSARFAQRSIGTTTDAPIAQALALSGQNFYSPTNFVPNPSAISASQQTLGLTLSHRPTGWWTQTATVGTDQLHTGSVQNTPRYADPSDTLLAVYDIQQRKTSVAYNSTFAGNVAGWLGTTLTVGADHWGAPSTGLQTQPAQTVGTLISPDGVLLTRTDASNTGYFAQGQLAVKDLVFFTVGSRWDHNTNYGRDVGYTQAPRYGVSVAHRLAGALSGKLRASYGRAIRAPLVNQRNSRFAAPVSDFPSHNSQLANPALGPESQRGRETGLELYLGQALSLSVSHYDQTVDHLIASVTVDSVRSLSRARTGQYIYAGVVQNLNVGSIRNRGWEGTATASWRGLTARGTWSNTISRVTYLTADLQQFNYPFAVGDQFGDLPEHSGVVGLTYLRSGTTIALTTSLIGRARRSSGTNPLFIDIYNNRFGQRSPGLGRTNVALPRDRYLYSSLPGYSTTDLSATRTLGRGLDGFVKVTNLADRYTLNDLSSYTPVQGRTTLVGVRRTW